MKKTTFIFICSLCLFHCKSDHRTEENKEEHSEESGENTLSSYQFTSKIIAQSKSFGNQGSAFMFSNIGRHFEALRYFDRDFPEVIDEVFYDSSNFKFFPAVDCIVKMARQHQIVIINEAHHVSSHRFFTRLLLKKLREIGFSHFGAETLIAEDTLLEKRGYPILKSGYFTKEPQYSNMVREAISANFKIFAYEASEGKNGMQREIEQARNIQKVLKSDSAARIIIHCGYGHIVEDEVEGWGKAMAGRLIEYTGIDPLTIDQVELTEHSEAKYENPYYKRMNFVDFMVPINIGKMTTASFRLDGHSSDLFVYHPRSHILYGRPHWLFSQYIPVIVNHKIKIAFPVIVKAYYMNEDETQALPVDVVEIKRSIDTTALALLQHRKYRLIVENENGEKQNIVLDF